MKRYFIAGFLILGLLLLGCTGQAEQTGNNTGPSGTSSTSSGGAPGGGGSSSSSSSGGNGGNGGLNLAGLGYAQLIALGVPVDCQYSDTQQGVTSQLTLKIKGNKLRGNGTTVMNGTATQTTFISVPEAMYVQLSADQRQGLMANCEWLKINTSGTNTSSTEVNGVETNPAGELAAATGTFDCVPGLFGDEAFAAPQNACDLNELINSALSNASNVPDPCDGIQNDAQKTACKAACGSVSNYMEKVQCAAGYMGG
ncbi:Uncharacterised protein [uncultured archaeon]|nr:Uncharacterised protein [uncultured archaeon]